MPRRISASSPSCGQKRITPTNAARPSPLPDAGGGSGGDVPVRTSPAAQLVVLGVALLLGALISAYFLPTFVPALFVLFAVPVLIGAVVLAISAASGRHRKPGQ